jgi:hypothetical protein
MNSDLAQRLGFRAEGGGTHLARTIMLAELSELLSTVTDPNASQEAYRTVIIEDNGLGKRSRVTRALTYRHLAQLYALDPEVPLFRGLRYFWSRDENGRALLALLCAYARDPLLRASAPLVLTTTIGGVISPQDMASHLEKAMGAQLSDATLHSAAQNVLASWTRSGHLEGLRTKRRSPARATDGPACYALFLGLLAGGRGRLLFDTEYARLLDCPAPMAMDKASEASRHGWCVFKQVADVVEVQFPHLLSPREKEWLHEQA